MGTNTESRHLAAALAVMFAFGGAPASGQDDALVKLYTEAKQAEAAGNYPAAIQDYKRIVELRPDMAEAYANLGNLYYVQGMWEQAGTSFKKAIRLKASLAAPHFFLGMLSFKGRDFEHAVTYLKEAERLAPANSLAALYLGYTYYAQNRQQEAAATLERVIAADEKNLDAWYHLSKLHGQLSKRYFEQLQTKHADSFFAALARSHFFESAATWEAAAQELSKAIALKPDNPELKQRLAWLAQRKAGDTAVSPAPDEFAGSTRYFYSPPEGDRIRAEYTNEALRARKAGERKTASAESLYQLADAHQALSFLSSLWVLQADPDSYRSHELRGEALEAAGKMDEAIVEYRRAIEIKPELQTVHFTIGNIEWRRGRTEEALAELTEELKLDPNDPRSHYESGDILLSENKLEEAEKHFRQALKFSPDLTEAHLALERIANARGDSATAILHLKKAAELDPASSTPHYRLWLIYRKLGRATEAQQERDKFEKLKALEHK
ncbi:MAG: tetratricopeptide repeat protein [Bryobacteraceae bacterium]